MELRLQTVTGVKKCSDWLIVLKTGALSLHKKAEKCGGNKRKNRTAQKEEEMENRKSGMELEVGGGGENDNYSRGWACPSGQGDGSLSRSELPGRKGWTVAMDIDTLSPACGRMLPLWGP